MEQARFGRYVVSRELGRGAMGTVYLAVDPLIEREVAVKTLLSTLPEDVRDEVRERFVREAKSAGRLNHPNVVTIYDVGEENGVVYMAMELLVGKTLADILREDPRLPFEKIADLIAQVADGLDHAHGFGIVHRDVKPANVVVAPTGRAKLTDFGVAHVASSSMTQTGATIGSPKYMSPEQVLGQPVAPNSDIFSLGVLLYEMLVGRTPFVKEGDTNVFALMHRIAGEPHQPVTQINAKIPAAFDQILAKALAKKPAERYQKAEEMARDLRRISGTAGAAAPPADAAYEKTQKLGPAQRPPREQAAIDQTHTQLIADVESFAKVFEKEEQERVRKEHEERARKEEAVRRWGEEEERKREEFERQRDPAAAGTQTVRRSAALEMLRKKAATKTSTVVEDRARKGEFFARLDERARAAFQYLSEFVTVLNDAHPVSERPYGVMYFGETRGVILGDGFTDFRTRHIEGKDRIDFVTFKYKVRFAKPAALEVSGQDLARVVDRLKALRIEHQLKEQKNEFGQVLRARIAMAGPFPCQVVLKCDYDAGGFALELSNVRKYGTGRLRLGADELTDELLDEFGTYVLGADDRFEKVLKEKAA